MTSLPSVSRGVRQWWTKTNDTHLFQAQTQLLEQLVKSSLVSAKKSVEGLNSVTFETTNATNSLPTVVMLHGFGSGLGFFYANIDLLLNSGLVGRVVLVDWMGMGGSERPACRRPIRGLSECTTAWCQSRFSPSQAVDFFLDPLHDFLSREKLLVSSTTNRNSAAADEHAPPPLWMVGHSLGGYLAARYLLRQENNTNLNKVVLASPVGFPVKPSNVLPSAQMPTAMRLVDALWSANVTPQQLVRALGASRGRRAVHRALQGRIPHLNNSTSNNNRVLELLAEYLFHITVAHPSGEFAMNSLLEPAMSPEMAGVFAREPLEPLFAQPPKHEIILRVLFGDHDWMRPNQPSASQAVERWPTAQVDIVPQAGHHLYLDNPKDFVQQILA